MVMNCSSCIYFGTEKGRQACKNGESIYYLQTRGGGNTCYRWKAKLKEIADDNEH